MIERRNPHLMRLYLGLFFFLLFLPLIVIIGMSFNSSRYGTLPFEFTTEWYSSLFDNRKLFDATWNSVQLSLLVGASAAAFGTLLSLWLVRYAKRLAVLVSGLLVTAITVPMLILGVAMLLVLTAIGIGRSYVGMYLGCLTLSLPFVVMTVTARLRAMDRSTEEAAASLGASPSKVFMRITLPQIAPAVAGGTLLGTMLCFNNFIIQYFLAPFGVQTLPLELYTSVRTGYSPEINALAALIVLVSVLFALIVQRLARARSQPRVSQSDEGFGS